MQIALVAVAIGGSLIVGWAAAEGSSAWRRRRRASAARRALERKHTKAELLASRRRDFCAAQATSRRPRVGWLPGTAGNWENHVVTFTSSTQWTNHESLGQLCEVCGWQPERNASVASIGASLHEHRQETCLSILSDFDEFKACFRRTRI